MDWSRKQTMELIQLLYRQRVLWDPLAAGYRDSETKDLAILEISKYFNCTPKQIERKLHTLRVQFRREHLLVRKSYENGRVYIPKWFGYRRLLFLAKRMKGKGSRFYQLQNSTKLSKEESESLLTSVLPLLSKGHKTNGNLTNNSYLRSSERQYNNKDNGNKTTSNLDIRNGIDYNDTVIKEEPLWDYEIDENHVISPNNLLGEEGDESNDSVNVRNDHNYVLNISDDEETDNFFFPKSSNQLIHYKNSRIMETKIELINLQKAQIKEEHSKKLQLLEIQIEHEKYKLDLTKLEVERKKLEIQIRSKMLT